jgi:hypothetical protein
MARKTQRTGRRPLRGEVLDHALTSELETMINEGFRVSPISLAAVARRLALGSRTTLYGPARLERIRAAAERQRQALQPRKMAAGSDSRSESELARLRKQLNEARGYIAQIAINAHRMGLQPEVLFSLSQCELRAGGAPWLEADRVVMQYLSAIGFLAKLDANVRGLAR